MLIKANSRGSLRFAGSETTKILFSLQIMYKYPHLKLENSNMEEYI